MARLKGRDMKTPYMIDWAITNRCNLDCRHCRRMAKEELDSQTVLKLAEAIPALQPRWVIIEGGEPLLRQELLEIIKTLRRSNIKIYLITNGMLLNEHFAQTFAQLKINLMISIDSPEKEDYEKIRSGASFEKLKEAVAIANKYKIFDSSLVTIGKYNYQQTDKIFQMAKEIGCPKITFLGLKPCRDYEKYYLNSAESRDFFLSVIRNQKEARIDVYVDEPFFQPFLQENRITYSPNPESGIIVPDVSRCIFGAYMFIETNGDIKPCTFAPLVVGNVKEKSLIEIWADMQNSELIKNINDFSTRESPCRECLYLSVCGGCRARSFYLTGNWFSADPSCPLKGG